jgi:hypothetical protein
MIRRVLFWVAKGAGNLCRSNPALPIQFPIQKNTDPAQTGPIVLLNRPMVST